MICGEDGKVLPFAELRSQLFYPTRIDIKQTHDIARQLAEEAASAFLVEFRDETKATAGYLSSIGGDKSIAKISKETRGAGMNKLASNSTSKSNHAGLTRSLEMFGTVRLDHAAAEAQTRRNNDTGRCHEKLVSKKSNEEVTIAESELGVFHSLVPELQESLIQVGREHKLRQRKYFDESLAAQAEASRRKEEIALERQLEGARDEYIVAIYLLEQFNSPRCWRTIKRAEYYYKRLKSETARLRAVKEQILIRYLGCGWEEAHHPWSSGNGTYTSSYLFKFLKEVVIPLEKKHAVPNEPPLELPSPPEMNKLGTTSGLALKFKSADDGELEEFKQEARKEIDKREAEGKGDRWMEM